MALEQFESFLYLPDDTPFFPDSGDDSHAVRLAWRAAALVFLALVVNIPVIVWGGFVWQDDWRVSQNVLLWSWGGLGRVWFHGMSGSYRPLAQTVLWVEHHFRGESPFVYHLVSIVLHGINGAALWMVLRRLAVPGAWLAAALFVVHPVQVQSVAWISQQPHVVGAAFFLGALWAFLRLAGIHPSLSADLKAGPGHNVNDLLPPEPVRLLYPLALLLGCAAMLSDPVGLALPVVLVLLLWWKQGTISRQDWVWLAPFLAVAIIGVGLALAMSRGSADLSGVAHPLSFPQRFVVAGRAAWEYARAIVWPHPLLFVYPKWKVTDLQWLYLLAVLVIGMITWASRRRWGNGPLALILMFLALLFPAFWAVLETPSPTIFIADHLQYLAAAVPLAVVGSLFVRLASVGRSPAATRVTRLGLAVISISLLGSLAFAQGWTVYPDAETAWQSTLARDKNSVVGRTQYAMLLLHRGKPADAARVLGDADVNENDDVTVLNTWAQVYLAQGRYPEAIDSYLDAQRLAPASQEILLGLANAYARSGRENDAIEVYREASRQAPGDERIYSDIGQIMMNQGRLAESIQQFDAALRINPRLVSAKINKANALFKDGMAKGDLAEARRAADELQEVVKIDPSDYKTFVVAAAMQYVLKDFAGAEQNCRFAVKLNPKAPEAWFDLGLAQGAQNHFKDAIWSFEKALKLKPDYEEANKAVEMARRKLASVEQ